MIWPNLGSCHAVALGYMDTDICEVPHLCRTFFHVVVVDTVSSAAWLRYRGPHSLLSSGIFFHLYQMLSADGNFFV